jgi:hypothetical protein
MKAVSKVGGLLNNLNNLHELGKQRAFELGNPFYSKYSQDGEYLRKELPNGDMFLCLVEVTYDEKGYPIKMVDTYLEKIDA